jgi:hypothetical protein
MEDKEKESLLIGYQTLLNHSFCTIMNANDFFAPATACELYLDNCDLEWAMPIIQKYPDYAGIHAVMSYIAKQKPMNNWRTPQFEQAYKEIEELNPKFVWSREWLDKDPEN